jgi:hypothetical protein
MLAGYIFVSVYNVFEYWYRNRRHRVLLQFCPEFLVCCCNFWFPETVTWLCFTYNEKYDE